MKVQDKLKMILFSICATTNLIINCQNTNVSSDSIKKQFIKLANAIKNKNYNELKMFFTFPIKNDYIWYKVLPEDELKSENISNLFTNNDFEKYYNKFFDTDIEEALNTLNFDKISFENENTIKSDIIAVQSGIYVTKYILSISFDNKKVILSVLSNIYTENDEYLSEHIDRYYFAVLDNRLQFSGFEMID